MDKFRQTRTLSKKSPKNICCSLCNKQFALKDFSVKISRQPFLLHCGHSICESCLLIKSSSMSYTCGQCRHTTTFQDNPKNNEFLPLNYYIIGYLAANQSQKYEKHKNLSHLTQYDIDFNYSMKESQETVYVCEECSEPGAWFCQICAANFCGTCWIKVHSSSKSLMKHKKSPLESLEENKENFFKKCSTHEAQNLEFFCKNCNIPVCSHCLICKHQEQSHSVVTLKEKNKEMIQVVKSGAEEAEVIYKRLKQTLEKVKLTQAAAPGCSPFEEIETQIVKNFSRFHGILQLEEEKALKELRDAASAEEIHLSKLRTKLEEEMENVASLLRNFEIAVKNPQTSNFIDFHEKFLDVKNLPCYLIPPENDGDSLTVKFDESSVTSVQNYCTLKIPKQKNFELRCGEDLPDDYQIDSLRTNSSDRNLSFSTDSIESEIEGVSSISSLSKGKSEPDVSGSKSFPFSFAKLFNIFEGRQYSVRLTYIKNPGEFYVLLNSQMARRDFINRKSIKFASFSNQIPENVSKGEVYLVNYVDGRWYRGSVIEVFASDEEIQSALVYYLDYGNKEKVVFSRLRPVPEEILECPPLAIKCKFFECEAENEDWWAEATEKMEKMLQNCVVKMHVLKIHPDCLEIDLSRKNIKGQRGAEVNSVRDILMLLKSVGGRKKSSVLKYPEQCLPAAGESLQVVISHVISCSDFYVKKIDSEEISEEDFHSLMQDYYEFNLEKEIIRNPFVGMACAALFSADQRWYRAKITNIPNNHEITVLYVDYGNEETISCFSVRQLKDCFAKIPPKAIRCSLVETQSNIFSNKRSQASLLLKNNAETEICLMTVQGMTKTKEKIKVFLYLNVDHQEVCFNDILSASNSVAVDRLNDYYGNKISSTYRNLHGINGSNKNKNRIKEKSFFTERKKLNAQELREQHASEKLSDKASTTTTEETKPFKIKVDILLAQSPSCIYVTFDTLQGVLTDLHSKLQEFYENSEYVDSEWCEDTKCAVYSSSEWHRASIIKILPDNKVKLFLKDVAMECIEPMSSLRPLDDSFSSYGPCAVKCHLSDIRPAGKEWPGISCEFLQSKIENCKEFFMSKKGEIEDKSLPVEIWVQRVFSAGALEPTVKEWVTLNRMMVEQGVAIPIKSEMKLFEETETEKEKISKKTEEIKMKKEETFIPSLSFNWLPPEKLTSSEFIGIPTYIDHNANIYIHDIKDEDRLKMIREGLLEEYENSKPAPEDHFWTPGQLCIVKYHMDNNWYRGVVLGTKENLTHEVLFTDYGNVEICQASEMRKRIKMAEVPTLVRKFRLHGISRISEEGKCSVEVLDLLHGLIVEKLFKVNVLHESSDANEPSTITLKFIENDVDIVSLMTAEELLQPVFQPNPSLDESFQSSHDSDVIIESEVLVSKENFDETPSNKNIKERQENYLEAEFFKECEVEI